MVRSQATSVVHGNTKPSKRTCQIVRKSSYYYPSLIVVPRCLFLVADFTQGFLQVKSTARTWNVGKDRI